MSSSESDDDSAWNKQLLLAVSARQGTGPSILEQDRIEQMQKCLDQGADIDTSDKKGNTALHIAVRKGYQDIVEFLLRKGARTDICNQEGNTAATLANNIQRLEIANILEEFSGHKNRRVINQPPPIIENMLVDDARPSTSQEDASPSPRDLPMQMLTDQRNEFGSKIKRKSNTDDKYNETAKKTRFAHDDSPQLAVTTDRVMIESQPSDCHEKYESTSTVKKTFHGIVYQWKHLMIILHRALKKGYSFRLATEMDAAEKFDDVVLEYEDSERGKVHRFMQIKHKQDDSQMITAKGLLDATDGDFSILKYFISWRAIKKNPTFDGSRTKEFILCTNIGLDVKGLNAKIIEVKNLSTDDLLKVTERAPPATKVTEREPPPRFYKLSDNWSELCDTLKFASDVHRLAREIADHVCKSKKIHLNTEMIRRYHAALVVEVINRPKEKFSCDFIENNNLSGEGKKFREAFIFHAKKFYPEPNAPEDVVWKFLERSRLKLSKNFGKTFKLPEPELTDVKQFSEEFATLVNKRTKNDVVKIIVTPIHRKDAAPQLVERVVADNIYKLAGHVLITENGKIKFRQRFLNDDTPLSGNMEEFRHALKTRLGSKFTELKKLEFKMNNYETCTEEELYSRTELPDDNISDAEISGFLNEFVLAVNQPNEQKLGEMIRREVGADSKFSLPNVDIIGDSYQNNIIDWLKESGNHSKFLKNEDAYAFLSAIEQKLSSLVTVGLCLSYLEELKKYNIKFDLENTDVREFLERSNPTLEQKILELPSPGQTLLTALRVYQTVKEDDRYHKDGSFFFLQLAKLRLPVIMEYVVRDFESFDSHHLLVIDCATNDITRDTPDLWKRLDEIVKADHNKRMILITEGNKDLAVRSETVISIGDLTKDSRQKLLEDGIVNFQGRDKRTNFGTLLGIRNCRDIESTKLTALRRIIDQQTLTQLIRGKEISIGGEVRGLRKVKNYYIPRTITGYVVIKRSVLQDPEKPDLFAITGIDSQSLERWLSPQEGTHEFDESNATKLDPVKYRFLEEDRAEDHFKDICDQNPNSNIHWLQAESGKLIWKRSHGNITDLMAFEETVPYDNAWRPEVSSFNEDQLMHHAEKRRIVIISDPAGMGKSTVLTHFAEKIKQNQPSSLVIKVDLTRHTFALDEQKRERTFKDTDTDKAVDFLVDKLSCLDTELEREVFKEIIKVTGGAELLFDGYDEISPEYESIVIDLLQALSSSCINRLFVTTRPHTSEELEKKLGTFSYHLQPFSPMNQTEFLIAFWKEELNSSDYNETVEENLKKHASKVLKILNESIDGRMEDFTGIPLLTRMVAEIFSYEEKGRQIDSDVPKKAHSITDLYKLFVDKKCKVFFEQKQLSDDTNLAQRDVKELTVEPIMMIHRKLALGALFRQKDVNDLLSCQPEIKKMSISFQKKSDLVERIGIVTQFINTRWHPSEFFIALRVRRFAHFVHRTFAEYFAAQFLFDTLIDNRRNEVVRKFFVDEIFFQPKYKQIRTFLNCFLSNRDYASDDTKESWKFILRVDPSNFPYGTLYHVAVEENNHNIIRFFSHRLSKFNSPKQKANVDIENSRFWLGPLHMAIKSKKSDIVKLLVEAGANIDSASYLGYTPLHYAVQTKDLGIVEYIVKKGAAINSAPTAGLTPLHHAVETKDLKIVSFIVEASADINSVDEDGLTPLHYAVQTKDLDIVTYIAEKSAGINSATHAGRTPLHYAVETKDLNIVRYIAEKSDGINAVDADGLTPLHYAVETKDLNIVRYIAEKSDGINAVDADGLTPLHYAVQTKDLDILRYIAEKSAGINSATNAGRTPLHYAVETKDLNIVRYIAEKSDGINAVDADGLTPLHYAVETKDLNIVRYIAEKSDGINAVDADGLTPLHYAVQTKDLDILRYIAEKSAGINSATNAGRTPLHYAVGTKDLDIVRYIAEKSAGINAGDNDGLTPMQYAVLTKNLDIVRYIVEAGADIKSVDKDGLTLLHSAVKTKDLGIVKYIVKKGVVINSATKAGLTPLHYAVLTENLDIVSLIAEETADINSTTQAGLTPLHYAVFTENLEIVRYIFEKGRGINSVDKGDLTPLRYAVQTKDLNIVRYIAEQIADINAGDADGLTPMHYAVFTKNLDTVSYIFERGAYINSVDADGLKPLHYAVKTEDLEIVKYIVKKGAEINSATKTGLTPLHYAVLTENLGIVSYIFENGGGINSVDKDGLTPLHYAVFTKNLGIVSYIFENGGGINSVDKDGLTPLHYAVETSDLEIVKYIVEKGAKINSATEAGLMPLYYAYLTRESNIINFINEKIDYTDSTITTGLILPDFEVETEDLGIARYVNEICTKTNYTTWARQTPLYRAVETKDMDIVNYIRKKSDGFLFETNAGRTPLHHAVETKDLDLVRYIAEKSADIHAEDGDRLTPMHYAVLTKNLDIVRYILEKDIGIDSVDKDGFTPVPYAVKTKKLDTSGYNPDTGICLYSQDRYGFTPVHYAVETKDLNIVRLIVDLCYDFNPYCRIDLTALQYAILTENLDIVSYIFEKCYRRYCRNGDGWTPLHYAVQSKDLNIVKYIVEVGAEEFHRSSQKSTPPHRAVEVKSLDAKGAVINYKDNNGLTPLHLAVISGRSDIVQYLLKDGANVNSEAHSRLTPRHIAVHFKNSSIVACLDEYGANLDREADCRLTQEQLQLLYKLMSQTGWYHYVVRLHRQFQLLRVPKVLLLMAVLPAESSTSWRW